MFGGGRSGSVCCSEMTVRTCHVPHLFQDVQEYQITTAVSVPVPPLCRSVPRECFLEKEYQGLGTADSCAFNSAACLENVCGCCAACAGRLLLLLFFSAANSDCLTIV